MKFIFALLIIFGTSHAFADHLTIGDSSTDEQIVQFIEKGQHSEPTYRFAGANGFSFRIEASRFNCLEGKDSLSKAIMNVALNVQSQELKDKMLEQGCNKGENDHGDYIAPENVCAFLVDEENGTYTAFLRDTEFCKNEFLKFYRSNQ